MNPNNPKVRIITAKEAEKIDKNKVAYFTLTDGTVAMVKNDDEKNINKNNFQNINKYNTNQINNNNIQSKINLNSNYSIQKIKNSYQNNNINEKSGYQIIEAIPVKFCENPQIKNYSQPEPLYVEPYFNPNISEVESYDDEI